MELFYCLASDQLFSDTYIQISTKVSEDGSCKLLYYLTKHMFEKGDCLQSVH